MHENNWGPRGDICSPEIIIILMDFCAQTFKHRGESKVIISWARQAYISAMLLTTLFSKSGDYALHI